jgi:hypothetical protein
VTRTTAEGGYWRVPFVRKWNTLADVLWLASLVE